jgi:AraC-like DNA-binding protein
MQMRSQIVAPFLARVRASGGDPEALIARFGLPASAETDAETVLPLSTLKEFFESVEKATGDPFVGIHVAAALPRGTYGLLEFICRSAPTVRESMARIVRCVSLLNEIVEMTFVEKDGEGVVEQRIPGSPTCVGRQGNEFFLAMLLSESRRVAGTHWVPQRVWFAHPAPRDLSELEQLFGTREIRFGAEANGAVVGKDVLDLPLTSSDPPLLSLLERQAEDAIAARAGPNRFLGHVQARIREQLGHGGPSLESVADALKMGPRTLQRRLADQGVGFQALVDSVRGELARLYIKDGRRPIGEVAFLLGYQELSAFFRAFKRWTGMTPSEFRGAP